MWDDAPDNARETGSSPSSGRTEVTEDVHLFVTFTEATPTATMEAIMAGIVSANETPLMTTAVIAASSLAAAKKSRVNSYIALSQASGSGRSYLLEFSDNNALQSAYQALVLNSTVELVQPVNSGEIDDLSDLYPVANQVSLRLAVVPDDPSYGDQWGLESINAQHSWDLSTGNSDVLVAVIGSGVDGEHPDLEDNFIAGYNLVSSNAYADDEILFNTGTHTAGIIAGLGNNGYGVAGTAWNVRIMPLKVVQASGAISESTLISAINYAVLSGADVIVINAFLSSASSVLTTLLQNVYTVGICIVAGIGDDGANSAYYPAAHSAVLAVGATDENNIRASISNYGIALDLVAPGEDIYSAKIGGFGDKTGTGRAAAFVAGAAALLKAYKPELTASQIYTALEASARDLGTAGRDDTYGYGLLDVYAAMAYVDDQSEYLADQTYTGSSTVSSPASIRFTYTTVASTAVMTLQAEEQIDFLYEVDIEEGAEFDAWVD